MTKAKEVYIMKIKDFIKEAAAMSVQIFIGNLKTAVIVSVVTGTIITVINNVAGEENK